MAVEAEPSSGELLTGIF